MFTNLLAVVLYVDSLWAGRSRERILVGAEICHTHVDWLCGPPSLLYTRYQDSFLEIKRLGRGIIHPSPSTAEVKEVTLTVLYVLVCVCVCVCIYIYSNINFSGRGKCGVAVIRISGPNAAETIINIAKLKSLPQPRQALLRSLKDPVTNETLDRGLVLWFPGITQLSELLVHPANELILVKLNQFQKIISV